MSAPSKTGKLIERQWLNYREQVIPKDAGFTQLTESRRAFYAGAESLLTVVMEAASPGGEVTPADLDLMARLDGELRAFAEKVQDGRA